MNLAIGIIQLVCSVYDDTSIGLYSVKHQWTVLRILMPSNFYVHCGGIGLRRIKLAFNAISILVDQLSKMQLLRYNMLARALTSFVN